jgi:uncharacterized membrane protein YdjX (TVP38/TMEM64 family)
MEELVTNLVNFIQSSGLLGVFLSCFILTIESIIPIIPLLVFISVNFIILGPVLGFIVSWIFTVLGSLLSYYLFKNKFSNKFLDKTKDSELVNKYIKIIKKLSTGKLLLIVALPFTPAFAVNIAAGILKLDFKKYLTAILFGKISLVVYSAYIGTTFIEGITNPILLVNLVILILIVYILFRIVKKVFKLNL